MERNLHQIAYRGNTVSTPNKAQKIRPATQNKIENTSPAPKIVPISNDLESLLEIKETNLQTAFQTIDANLSKRVKHGTASLFPYDITVLTPIVSAVETGTVFEAFKECRTFASLAKAMKEYRSLLNESGAPADMTYFGKIWLGKLDRFIVEHVNSYFMNAMGDGFRITSVMEDGEEIQQHVSNTFQTKANPAFTTYQKTLFASLFSSDAHNDSVLPDLEEPPTDVVDYEIVTNKYLVVTISATADELNYNVDRMPLLVTRDTPGELYDILFQVSKLAKQTNATRTWLTTLDGKKWALWEMATASAFKIYEE